VADETDLIVVTGGVGFLGREIVNQLASAVSEVLVVDRYPPYGRAIPADAEFHGSNLTDPSQLLPARYHGRPFSLLHLVWDLSERESFESQLEMPIVLSRLLDFWVDNGLRRLIVPGSVEEYGAASGQLSERINAVPPFRAYGIAKRACHDICQSVAARHSIPVFWLRPFLVYGPGQTGGMLLPYVIRCLWEGKRAKVSDGLQQRDFVYVSDVARAFVSAVFTKPIHCFDVFNIGTGKATPVRSVLELVGSLLGDMDRIGFGEVDRRPGEPLIQYADTQYAESALGWRAAIDLETGIAETLRHGEETMNG